MGRCGACTADTVFKRSGVSEHSLILDAEPVKGVILLPRRVARLLDERVARFGGNSDDEIALVRDVFADHHTTCPHAALFAKGGPLAGDAAKARRVAANLPDLLGILGEVARYPIDDGSDARLVALRAQAGVVMEAIEG